MYRYSIFFFIFCYFPLVLHGQNAKIDSLLKVLPTLSQDTSRATTYNLLAAEMWRNKTQEALSYADSALVLSTKLKYLRGQAFAHNYMGLCLRISKNTFEALPHFKEALALSKRIQDKQLLGMSNNNMGIAYLDQAVYSQALEYFFTALKYNEENNDFKGQATQLNNIGLIYKALKDYNNSLVYFQKALKLNQKENNKVLIPGNYNNMGLIYKELNQLDTALKYFQVAAQLNGTLGNTTSEALNLGNVAEIYIQRGNILEARKTLLVAKELNEKAKNKSNLQSTYLNLAKTYIAERKYDVAENYIKQAQSLNNELKNRQLQVGIFKEFAKLYQIWGKYEQASRYWQDYSNLRDSILSKDMTDQVAKMQTIYDTDKKEKENELLRKEQQVTQAQLQRQFFMGIAIVGALVSMVIVALILFKNNRDKQKTNQLLTQQAMDLQEANQQITVQNEELHQQQEEILAQRDFITNANEKLTAQYYHIQKSVEAAKLIQQAVLPFEERVKLFLPNYFVLYKPKDVVSGDFYWIEKIDEQTFVAVVDCTGHGVPGAFMSMIGNILLDHILKIQKVYSPDEVLAALNEEIHLALKQDEQNGDNHGMDIAFVALRQENNQTITSFAGAKRPLCYVSAGSSQIEIIKGDRHSIGGKRSFHKVFTKQVIVLPQNSMLYLSSDGYADQCDEQRNTMGNTTFYQILASIAKEDLPIQQQQLATQLVDYQKSAEQRDDILVLGIKL